MVNDLSCIVCGKEIENKAYRANIKSMDVTFCSKHKDYCKRCTIKECGEDCELIEN